MIFTQAHVKTAAFMITECHIAIQVRTRLNMLYLFPKYFHLFEIIEILWFDKSPRVISEKAYAIEFSIQEAYSSLERKYKKSNELFHWQNRTFRVQTTEVR
jgi:hypothetical protein